MDVSDGLPTPRRYWAVAAILSTIGMTVLDGSITNVALPTIARELDVVPATSIWIVNAYQLAIVVSLLPFASLGENLGYRRVFIAGLTVFTVASAACALSTSFWPLLIARTVQGFGGAAAMSMFGGLVRLTYPNTQLGRGIGYNAITVATCSTIGPTLSSFLLSFSPWPILFAVNVPIGLAAIWMAVRALPQNEPARRPLDWTSAVMNAVTLGLLVVSLNYFGKTPVLSTAGLAIAAIAGVMLYRRESGRPAPLVPLDLLRTRAFVMPVIGSTCYFGAQAMALVSLPFYLQHTMHLTQVQTGFFVTPWAMGTVAAAMVAGRLADRFPTQILSSIGAVLIGTALILLAALPATNLLIGVMVLGGVGAGLFQTPNNRALLMAAPRSRSGSAGGMQSISRQLGMTVGTALVALILSVAPNSGTMFCLLTGAGFAAVALFVSFVRGRPSTQI